MPPRFALQVQGRDGGWITEAVCTAEQFKRAADGSYVCSQFSSGLWIRCVADHGDWLEHEDGAGGRHRYRKESFSVPYGLGIPWAATSTRGTRRSCSPAPSCVGAGPMWHFR